jgi:hypothetical protein
MSAVSHEPHLFFSRNYTLVMQLVSLITASAIAMTILTQAVSTWDAPRERQSVNLAVSAYRQAIRYTMIQAIHTQQSIDVVLPETAQITEIRTLMGHRITAYPDGTVSPGQIRICGRIGDTVLRLSSLGRTSTHEESTQCDLPAAR